MLLLLNRYGEIGVDVNIKIAVLIPNLAARSPGLPGGAKYIHRSERNIGRFAGHTNLRLSVTIQIRHNRHIGTGARSTRVGSNGYGRTSASVDNPQGRFITVHQLLRTVLIKVEHCDAGKTGTIGCGEGPLVL